MDLMVGTLKLDEPYHRFKILSHAKEIGVR